MPTISMFYGILILMYFYDDKKHARPHIHAEYGDQVASIAIDDGEVLSGSIPPPKMKLVQAASGPFIEFVIPARYELVSFSAVNHREQNLGWMLSILINSNAGLLDLGAVHF